MGRAFVGTRGSQELQSQGLDLSASYVGESPRFGQFILSTKATWVQDFRETDGLREAGRSQPAETASLSGADLQSSVTLTWQIGNHTASAVTHYADSFEELSDLNPEELDALFGKMTTVDLQYGYTLKTRRQGNAVISVGLRSVVDKGAGQFTSRGAVPENTGRMAYGSIKHQF